MSRLVRKSKKMYRHSKPTAFGVKESNKKLSRWGLPCGGKKTEDVGMWRPTNAGISVCQNANECVQNVGGVRT